MGIENNIRTGRALPGPGMAFDAPTHDYREILGSSAELQPAGENVSLDALLPRSGKLARQIALSDWGPDWVVLRFDETLEFNNVLHSHALIRARWVGVPIGGEFCPVFVLLDPDGKLSSQAEWSSSDFDFVSWGFIKLGG